jgi:hypothetical protein
VFQHLSTRNLTFPDDLRNIKEKKVPVPEQKSAKKPSYLANDLTSLHELLMLRRCIAWLDGLDHGEGCR